MSFIASGGGTGNEWRTAPDATNYIDMVRKIQQFADDNNESLDADTGVVSGGTSGYAVGDFLQLADGAATEAFPSTLSGTRAVWEVTGVSAGVVTTVLLRTGGCYSTLPTNNGTGGEFNTTALTGAGVGTVTIGGVTFAGNGYTIDRITQEIATANVGAVAGTGYSASDTLELTEGDSRTGYDAPQATNKGVLTLSGLTTGSAMTVTDAGIFHRQPPTNEAVTNALTGGGDNAMTADLTFQEFTDTTTDIELIMTGAAGTVGIRTFNNGTTVYNMEIAGMQAYTAGNDWDAQVNMSPGRFPDDGQGSYVVSENETFSYFLSITDRRIVAVFRVAVGTYPNMYLGAFDALATATEYPVPLLVLGCSSIRGLNQGSAESRWAGMNLSMASLSTDTGPGAVLSPGGVWTTVQNGYGNAANGDIDVAPSYTTANIMPGGDYDLVGSKFPDGDEFLGDDANSNARERWLHWCVTEDPDGPGVNANSNDYRWLTMGNQGGPELPTLWTMSVVDTLSSAPSVYGELDGVKYVDQRVDGGSGFMASEDEIVVGSEVWYVFNNCRLDRHWTYFAMRGS